MGSGRLSRLSPSSALPQLPLSSDSVETASERHGSVIEAMTGGQSRADNPFGLSSDGVSVTGPCWFCVGHHDRLPAS